MDFESGLHVTKSVLYTCTQEVSTKLHSEIYRHRMWLHVSNYQMVHVLTLVQIFKINIEGDFRAALTDLLLINAIYT